MRVALTQSTVKTVEHVKQALRKPYFTCFTFFTVMPYLSVPNLNTVCDV